MNYLLLGGSTNWSKTLIKNFNLQKNKLKFTSSRFLDKKENIINYKKIPLEKIDFVVLSSDTKRNIKAAKYFTKKKLPIFMEKPLANSYKSYKIFKKSTSQNSIYFCDYLHIYSDPIQLIKKRLEKENINNIQLYFGKNGKERSIKASYEWLPHPLSILFYLKNQTYENVIIKYKNFVNKKKTNLEISFKKKNFKLFISSGNNFSFTKYIVDINTDQNHYIYDGTNPKKLIINGRSFTLKHKPLFNSISTFLKLIKNKKAKKLLDENKKISEKIMSFLHKKRL